MKPSLSTYSPIKQHLDFDNANDDDTPYTRPLSRSSPWFSRILTLAALFLAAVGGYALGRRSSNELDHGLLAPPGDTYRTFIYNRTFAMAPTEHTAESWRSLYPENGGFIHHPYLATNFSGIAVFHQLHCLQALYYLYYNATGEGTSEGAHEHHAGHRVTPPAHARHCFDYLRQSLICQADTNLEQYNYTLDGVTGWGEKRCRDYGAIMRFAEEWGGNKYAE